MPCGLSIERVNQFTSRALTCSVEYGNTSKEICNILRSIELETVDLVQFNNPSDFMREFVKLSDHVCTPDANVLIPFMSIAP